ncbi:hypothetical protein DXA21_21855 [Parabacteroides distasonis]|nr:hypothetical protein DXA21_21855 [Parabacteroides distasonis]
MYVDYLRVYQQGNGTNTTTPSTTTKANTTTKPATTTKAPATSPVETITKVSYEDTDLVANTDKKFGPILIHRIIAGAVELHNKAGYNY